MAGSLQDYHPSVSFDFDIMSSLEKFKVADSPFYISHKKLNSPLNKGRQGRLIEDNKLLYFFRMSAFQHFTIFRTEAIKLHWEILILLLLKHK